MTRLSILLLWLVLNQKWPERWSWNAILSLFINTSLDGWIEVAKQHGLLL